MVQKAVSVLSPQNMVQPAQVHLGERRTCVDLGVVQTHQLGEDLKQKRFTCVGILSSSVKWETCMNV